MKTFLINFAGSFAACVVLIAIAYFNTTTRVHMPEINHYLTPAEFPLFAAGVIGVSFALALGLSLLKTFLGRSR